MAKAMGHSPGQQDAFSKQLDGWTPLAAQRAAAEANSESAGASDPGGGAGSCRADPGLPTASGHPLRRHGDLRPAGGRGLPGRVGADGRTGRSCSGTRTTARPSAWSSSTCSGLGMLSALHYAVDLVAEHEQKQVDFATLDLEEPAVYEMLQRADSVGVFQVESRAQMATLPRLTAPDVLRPGRGGGADPARSDPGQLGAPVHPAAQRVGGGHLRPSGDGTVAGQDPRHPAVPGTADAAGGRRRRVRRRRGRPAAPGHGSQAVDRSKMEKLRTRLYDGMARLHGITGDAADRIYERLAGVRELRVRRVARTVVRRVGVLLVLAQAVSPGGVLRGPAAGPADGVLLAAVAGRRRPAARGDRATAGHQPLPGPGGSGTRSDARRTSPIRRSGSGWPVSAPSATTWPSSSSPPDRRDGYAARSTS